jgi:hypothetical protein
MCPVVDGLWRLKKMLKRIVLKVRRLRHILLRKTLNRFAKSIIATAKDKRIINNVQFHEIAGIIDKRLWPEWYK